MHATDYKEWLKGISNEWLEDLYENPAALDKAGKNMDLSPNDMFVLMEYRDRAEERSREMVKRFSDKQVEDDYNDIVASKKYVPGMLVRFHDKDYIHDLAVIAEYKRRRDNEARGGP